MNAIANYKLEKSIVNSSTHIYVTLFYTDLENNRLDEFH